MLGFSCKSCISIFLFPFLVNVSTVFAASLSDNSFGLDTQGGHDGQVLKVTSLNSHGQGSLRWAISQTGTRIVVFEVGGVIDLSKESILIDHPNLTIAGQTAPAPGITLIRGGIKIVTHDVIIQHLMVRPGDNDEALRSGWESDGISVSGSSAYRVLIDHCSLTWAVDENLSASGPRDKGHEATSHDIGFTNNIIAEGLDNSTHKKGKHSKGLLVHDYVQNVAIIGNLFAHNDRRNPYFKGHTSGVVVNNLLYDVGNAAVQVGYILDEYAKAKLQPLNPRISVVGNKLIYGNSSYSDLPLVAYQGDVYLLDNTVTNLIEQNMPQIQGAVNILVSPPVWPAGLKAVPVEKIEASILLNVGARPWQRDPVDKRIIDSVIGRKGHIIDSQNNVGGYPQYHPTVRELRVPNSNIEQWIQSFEEIKPSY